MADSSTSHKGRNLLIVLLVLLLLAGVAAVVGDPIARRTAQDRVATSLQQTFGTQEKPTVAMKGTPFLTQLLGDHYQQVQIDAKGVTSTEIPLQGLHVLLDDVTADKSFSKAVAKKAAGAATVSWNDVGARVNNLPVSFADPDRIRADYQTTVFGIPVVAQVTAKPAIDQGAQTLVLVEPTLNVSGIQLPADMAKSLLESVVKPIPVPLPASLKAMNARATADGMIIDFEGTDVDLTKLG